MNPLSLRSEIQQVLTPLGLYSPDAEELLMATCAQESLMGQYRHQVSGPAVGIFQMEPRDFDDIWTNYLAYHWDLAAAIRALSTSLIPQAAEMQDNDALAIAMCRVHYLRAPTGLPSGSSLNAMWAYYKQYYNTPAGAAKQIDFVRNYHNLVGGAAR
jgi:hypothetical protein